MEAFSLAIGTTYRFGPCKIDLIRYPAFRAVGKGWGLNKRTLDSEFPAVDAESTMSDWLFFSGKTLDIPLHYGYNP